MDSQLIIDIADESATRAFGQALAATLPTTAVVALIGPLGAGKTRLVQAVAEAAGVQAGIVTSPTFVLVHEYAGRVPIVHFDVYRIRDEDEFLALGPEEYFSRAGWSFIEWGDQVSNCLPDYRLEISFSLVNQWARRISVCARGQSLEPTLSALRQKYK
jgi:tRNA threonylcarbamoyladenosine biosynthesis protein TsaE